LAASIALLFGLYSYFFGYKTYETGIGESEIVLLADGSTIEMNANSKLSFKRFGWSEDRVVDFEGEAFFDVQPGNDFTVNIPSGTISVVGTQFNVRDRNNLKVQCYEGSIVFTSNREQTPIQLSQGMELHFLGGEMLHKQFEGAKPDWTHGFSTFNEQPFNEVLDELALQFPITFKLDSINTDRLFTGRFSYHNLEDALKTTMEPMGITYVISEDKRIVTLSK
jgi:ferric-dicitrate binding protein FerR (iron transport regulator)